MAYRISTDRSNKTLQKEIKRIAREQIDKAIGEIDNDGLALDTTVHQVRKRCKKIRGLIRIVRPEFDAHDSENAFFRDAAKSLSDLRDAQVMIDTYDSLMAAFDDQIKRSTFAPIRRALTLRRQRMAGHEVESRQQLALFREAMQEAEKRTDSWLLAARGFAAVEGGLQKTYRRARKGMKKAYAGAPRAELFHEWRKRVKYHRYHLRLLRPLWPPVIEIYWQQAKDLSDLLGDEHDLAVLQQTLKNHPDEFANIEALSAFMGLIKQRRTQLQRQAKGAGERLLAEKPKQLSRRLKKYWKSDR